MDSNPGNIPEALNPVRSDKRNAHSATKPLTLKPSSPKPSTLKALNPKTLTPYKPQRTL